MQQAPYEDLPWLFFGEEQHMCRQLWCAGYDMYAPPRSIAFHLWSRQGRPALAACVQQVNGFLSSCRTHCVHFTLGIPGSQGSQSFPSPRFLWWGDGAPTCGISLRCWAEPSYNRLCRMRLRRSRAKNGCWLDPGQQMAVQGMPTAPKSREMSGSVNAAAATIARCLSLRLIAGWTTTHRI